MKSENKYELLYRDQAGDCGEPFVEFVEFAEQYRDLGSKVLDLGCGQGRDAILFAKQGFLVTGVDISPTGVEQMVQSARSLGLEVEGIVGDIRVFESNKVFDVIIMDRTLHMLKSTQERLDVLSRSVNRLSENGHILIADERSNVNLLKNWFNQDQGQWHFQPGMKPSFCFVERR